MLRSIRKYSNRIQINKNFQIILKKHVKVRCFKIIFQKINEIWYIKWCPLDPVLWKDIFLDIKVIFLFS
ncbi:hypothetical protein BpHYR1_052019 [Brachionus plicatilis]|uniref:Uncharacterized protein n=1 Tax=Brachionus plicatilis TaxID=10195 RepID=A0A3M7PL76_BRAPC|nr:hypothetical protein BpHYR1_052019 [Brachionus plicatilis]